MRLLLFNLATDADDPVLGFTTRWIGALARQVEFIHIITMRAGRLDLPENVRVYSVGKEKGFSELRRLVEFYRVLRRILREDRIDACFSHMMPLFTVLAGPVLRYVRIPIVTWFAHPRVTWILRLAHHLSTHMVASLAMSYPYRRDKLIVTGQGIDTDLFSADSAESTAEGPETILCVGRLSPVKDHPTLLKAVALLRTRPVRAFQLVMIGGTGSIRDEPYVKFLKDLTRELALEDIVRFEAPVPIASLPAWYKRSTLYVNMTPTGSGDKVALEAMACGLPSVVANLGFKDTLGSYAEKLLYEFGDSEQLAQKLEWVLSLSKIERTEIGNYLREQVVSMHGLNRLARNLVDIFEGNEVAERSERRC
jgi:glycosyltransferase involved in cell wall biosynthesis